MVNIRCVVIDQDIIEVARTIANIQKDVVKINAPTESMEVHHEEVSEGKTQEDQEAQAV